MARQPSTARSAHLTVRIDPAYKSLIKSCAAESKLSVSEWIRWAVRLAADQEYPELYYMMGSKPEVGRLEASSELGNRVDGAEP